ncbi:sel1 repeat family protein [Shewanella sp. JM162201]|uniref:Sel1 repeat family protein n=1 Tax=Shewanella jiangmenensis TaxID=2837387 RepID=A0ABS5V452_9GAMM|nr:DUF4145 domain-containing protein [Shewanella jiangmenensis]MBT1445233.1 sel1 repeat family protein [Shewanella jiangmenensis]
MTDSQLIAAFDAALGEDYRQARRYARDVPSQSLLTLRSALYKLTGILADTRVHFDSPNLYNRIEALSQARVLGVRQVRAMHRLRADGNRGAHPEKYHLSQADLLALAQKSLQQFCQLVAGLSGAEPTAFEFEPLEDSCKRELCYRAVMQDDAEAQYLLGMAFKAEGLMARDLIAAAGEYGNGLKDESAAEPAPDAERLLAKAKHWFSEAASLPKARYELAVAWLHCYGGNADTARGLALLREAVDLGVEDACALLGFCALTGQFGQTLDFTLAEELLSRAAQSGHSEAEANLGVLFYQQGLTEQAFRHIESAARAGFPPAQYHLYLLLGRGEGCQADAMAAERWLAEAASQGQLDAMFLRARHMLHDESTLGSDLKLAEDYLRQVIRYSRSVPAMVELSMALADGMLGRIDVVGAAALLHHGALIGNDEERSIIAPLWQSLASQVERVLALSQNADEKKALERAKELLLEMPGQGD